MKRKNLRMLLGIILHPFRLLRANLRRREYEKLIRDRILNRHWLTNHERMHWMSSLTNTAYTKSELYNNLYRNALD